jgi:hypothetical protein
MDEDHNGNLVLSGFKVSTPFVGYNRSGYYAERTVDVNGGNTIREYLTKEPLKTEVVCNPVKWASGAGDKSLFFYQIGFTNNGFYYPGVIDISVDTFTYEFEFDDKKQVLLNNFSNNASNFPIISGPFTNDNERFTFLAVAKEQNGINKFSHSIWITDREGTVLKQEAITDWLGETYYQSEQKDSLILLSTIIPEKNWAYFGHRGYTLIDMEGNVVRRNSRMVIDG